MIDLTFIRPIIEQFYEGRATVRESRLVKDPETKLSRPSEYFTVYEDIPCRLSNSEELHSETRELPYANHTIKLFTSPDYDIKPGSHIIVTQHGRTYEFGLASRPARYCTHQEINLESWDKSI